MRAVNSTQNNNNTHNGSNLRRRPLDCTNARPCYREAICEHCLNRRIKFICQQIEPLVNESNLCQFVTLTLPTIDDFRHGLSQGVRIRKAYHCILKQAGPYISVLALKDLGETYVPHLHSLSGALDKDKIAQQLVKLTGSTTFNLNIKLHRTCLISCAKRRVGYMLKKNYKPTLPFKNKRQKLVTASRGLCVSRPTRANLQKRMARECYE